MSMPESDAAYRGRLMLVVAKIDRFFTLLADGPRLDAIGRKYDVFRTGVPLPSPDGFTDGPTEEDRSQLNETMRTEAAVRDQDRELEFSPLSGRVTRDGITVDVKIYRLAGTDDFWQLEVVDHLGGSTDLTGILDRAK